MRITLTAAAPVIAALMLLVPAGARAASEPADPPPGFTLDMQRAAELMRQSLDKALGSVETLLRAVPRYELPQMDENGDIIMRRKRPSEPSGDQDGRSI
jgi:hypothetical protein